MHSRMDRSHSFSSDEGSHPGNKPVEEPILVYHESARSIVFRDNLRRAVRESSSSSLAATQEVKGSNGNQSPQRQPRAGSTSSDALETTTTTNVAAEPLAPDEAAVYPSQGNTPAVQIAGFQPKILPLPALELDPSDEFQELLESICDENSDAFTDAEKDVCQMLREQRCTVKTIKNVDWTDFLQRFLEPRSNNKGHSSPREHDDIAPDNNDEMFPFNSFVTSTSLLPPDGKRMRCFGSPSQYTTGVIFSLPSEFEDANAEDEAAARSQTWSWPSGYSAKTEFNIDSRGRLLNGRQEAIRPLSVLRQYNDDYLNKDKYMVGNRMVSGLSQIPYNEVFLRVGGLGRLVHGCDCATGVMRRRSFDRGCGIPVALFVRTVTFGHLISLLRTRSRMMHVLGERHIREIPLLFVCPELGVRVLTESLQRKLWKIASSSLTPFQNSTISYKTTSEHTDEQSFQQKVDELIEFDASIRETLTPEELARLAGGFGATDDSVADVLQQVMMQDKKLNQQREREEQDGHNVSNGKSHMLQDVVNEGLAAAVRSGDYHTSRQLLLLYSLVASQANLDESDEEDAGVDDTSASEDGEDKCIKTKPSPAKRKSSLGMIRDTELAKSDMVLMQKARDGTLSTGFTAPPPPPPLDTDRLRSATNCDGLLAVLGAAQVLKAMQDGGAKKRAQEAMSAVEEWINYGEQSMAFRISSWYDQRAAQGDLKIATATDTKFMAFVSNKAISNRKSFAQQLRDAVGNTDFNDVRFLHAVYEILSKMHSPCLRLELLQYILGLDNRYSVAHVLRSVELAASCLSISASAVR